MILPDGAYTLGGVKIAIVFASKNGTTCKAAKRMASLLAEHEVDLINLGEVKKPRLDQYQAIALGTAIYAGKPLKMMKALVKRQEVALQKARLGLFVCGMMKENDKRASELADAFPESLHASAVAEAFLGGEFNLDQLTAIEKLVISRIAGEATRASTIDDNAIEVFAKQLVGA